MTTVNHMLTGASIAVLLPNPFIAFPLAFISHFACDALPHFGFGGSDADIKKHDKDKIFWRVMAIDGFLSIFVLSVAFFVVDSINPFFLIASMLLAMSPDLVWMYRFLRERKITINVAENRLIQFHRDIQTRETVKLGLTVEALWFVSFIGITSQQLL